MILVTGSTGTIGSATVAALREQGAAFRVGVRDPQKVPARDIPAVRFAWDDPSTYAAALEGVTRAFLLMPPSVEAEEWTKQFAGQARDAGVGHLVKLSAIGASPRSPIILGRQHGVAEQIIKESGLAWTMLQPTFFMQNFLNYYGVDPAKDSTVYLPNGDGKVTWIDARDIGAAAAAALTTEGHGGRTYVLTGPEALSTAEALAILGEALGHSYSYVDVPEDAARQGMAAAGMPAWLVDAYIELHAFIRSGRASVKAPGLNQALGREGRTMGEMARGLGTR